MKKRLARISATMLAAGMMFTTAVPTFAAGTLTMPSTEGTYEVFQIFTGNYSTDTKKLSDVKWGLNGQLGDEAKTDATTGENVDAAILDELAVLTGTKTDGSTYSDREKLDVILKYADLEEEALLKNIAASAKTESLTDGYYLVKHTAADGVTTNTYLVAVVGGDVELKAKVSDTPKFDKEVFDEDAGDVSETETKEAATDGYWGETADHSINEVFQFRLTATLPTDSDIDTYKAYYLNFKDTLSKHITYDGNVSVKITETDGTETTINTADLASKGITVGSITTDTDGNQSFSIAIQDLKTIIGSEKTLQGVKVEVFYDAHLNEKAVINNNDDNQNTASLEYSSNPEWNGTGKPDTGETEEDTVFVFTYDLTNLKVREDGKTALKDAEFALYTAVDDGEGNTVAGTKIGLIYDEGQGGYRPVKDGETATNMVSPENGIFKIVGVDAGTYVLVEEKAPEGYTEADDMVITIEATHKENSDKASADTSYTKKVNNEQIDDGQNKIINEKPSNLPSTGGMGTTLFYSLGGVIAVGAGATLVTKKRMQKK